MNLSGNGIEAIFEHSYIGIIIVNINGEIEAVNPFGAQLFGYNQDELIGQKIEILLPHSLRNKHISYRKEYNDNPSPRSMGIDRNLLGVRKDDTEFSVEISLSNYEVDGEQKVVSFINDITDRKEVEKELRGFTSQLETKVAERTKELSQALVEINHTNISLRQSEEKVRVALEREKELSEMKSRFVSMASHEFRTPLAGILTSAILIEKYHSPETIDKKIKHIKSIKKSVKNLTTILGDFLSLDKLDQGIINTKLSNFNLEHFTSSIVEDTEDLSLNEQKIIYNHVGEKKQITQDQDMLRNVFINLISNAMKYSSAEKNVYIQTEVKAKVAIISVRDEGIGIPEDEQKHLFQKFFRAKNAANLEGTGLGLNIVKRYLDLMRGTIDYTTNENIGTTFTVTIPTETN